MRRAIPILAALALLLPAGATAAQADPCTVTPNPLTLGTDTTFTVTATGAVPLEFYEVTDQQKQHHKTDEARVWFGQADDTGTITATIGVDDGRIVGDGDPYALWPGDVTVKIVRYRTGGNTGTGQILLTTCGFTVI